MVTAFNYSEKYRTPVIFLSDEIIGHLREQVILKSPEELEIVERNEPTCDPEDYRPYDHSNGLAPLSHFGSPYVFKVNGSMHDEWGRPCARPDNADRIIRHLSEKIEAHAEEIAITRKYNMDDAEIVLICYGGAARSALSAMKKAREKGIKAGVLQLVTLWPVPEKDILAAMQTAKAVVVPELNLGQYIGEVAKRNSRNIPVRGVNRIDGQPIFPAQILEAIEEEAAK